MAPSSYHMRNARVQFSFLLLLMDLIESLNSSSEAPKKRVSVGICEPLFLAEDIALLQHFQISTLKNTFGSYPVSDPLPVAANTTPLTDPNDNDMDPGYTLFWMPHCARELYSAVLRSNWAPRMLSRVIIIGNSLPGICESLPSEINRVRNGRIFAANSVLSASPLPDYSEDPFVFSGTCLHTFSPPDHLPNDPFWSVPLEEDTALQECFSVS